MPIAIIGYFGLNRISKNILANVFLIAMSLWFYGYFNKYYLAIICTSILVNWCLSRLLHRIEKKKLLLILGILFNISIIFYFKYFDFFVSNINIIFSKNFELRNIVLPLGISFYTFQQISFIVDSYHGETEEYNFIEYALFVSFFPQLIAGPIVLHKEMIPQFNNPEKRKLSQENLSKGIYFFAIGLLKKVIIADTFGKSVAWGFSAIDQMSSLEALLVSLAYTFQIYFDFSGYCDMAVGIGKMFNIDMPINFNSPYKATSIIEFWKRWHMTLTRFLRTYIYFPLGGSKKGKVRTYVNIMIVFLVSGLWHGANWTFIVWGGIHGIAQCLNRMFSKTWEKIGSVTQWFLTFMFVNFAWVIFRVDTLKDGVLVLKKIISMNDLTLSDAFLNCFQRTEILGLQKYVKFFNYLPSKITGFNMWILFAIAAFIVLNAKNISEMNYKPNGRNAILTVIMLTWSIMSLAGVSTFIYFNF